MTDTQPVRSDHDTTEEHADEAREPSSAPPSLNSKIVSGASPTAAVKSVVTEFPKVLAGVGGLLAAITALVTALNGATWLQRETPTPIPTATVTITVTLSPTPTLTPTPTPLPTDTPLPTATHTTAPSPTPEPTAIPTARPVVYLMEDFGDAASGWTDKNAKEWGAGYVDGEYRITVQTSMLTAWGQPAQKYDFTNLRIQVDARQVSGDTDAYFGIILRYTPEARFYLFAISDDGMYIIQRSDDEGWTDLAEWAESPVILQSGQMNQIVVECLDTRMLFSVNGKLLAEVADDAYPSGSIGLLGGTFSQDFVEVRFDNLRLQVIDRL